MQMAGFDSRYVQPNICILLGTRWFNKNCTSSEKMALSWVFMLIKSFKAMPTIDEPGVISNSGLKSNEVPNWMGFLPSHFNILQVY